MKDALLTADFDLATENGDIATGNSDQQSVTLLMRYQKGELRRCPWIGFGIVNRIKSVSNKTKDLRDMKVELENDVFADAQIEIADSIQDFKIIV